VVIKRGGATMISPEIIRRYPFFAGLSLDQINTLAKVADEEEVKAGHFFLNEGEEVPYLYFVLEGTVNVVIELPKMDREIIVTSVGPGEVFAWSALVPPHTATASVKATTPCHVVAIDCRKLLEAFEDDYQFGYVMMTKAAQVTRDRISRMNVEMLTYLAEESGG
jgi:CRP-like cAMP-binding protein